MDVMLDLETLGTRPDSVILTIGAVKFDPFTIDRFSDTFYYRTDVDEQIERGRHVSDDTMAWWASQGEDVREEALSMEDRTPIDFVLDKLNRYLVGVQQIWAQGPIFDIGMMENLYRQWNRPPPWQSWQIRDSRTLFGTHGDPRVLGRESFHNALADCVYQAKGVQEIYQKVGIVKHRWN